MSRFEVMHRLKNSTASDQTVHDRFFSGIGSINFMDSESEFFAGLDPKSKDYCERFFGLGASAQNVLKAKRQGVPVPKPVHRAAKTCLRYDRTGGSKPLSPEWQRKGCDWDSNILISRPTSGFRKFPCLKRDPAAATLGALRRNRTGFGRKRKKAKRLVREISRRCSRKVDGLNYLRSAQEVLRGHVIMATPSQIARLGLGNRTYYLTNGIYQICRHQPWKDFKRLLKFLPYCRTSLSLKDLRHLACLARYKVRFGILSRTRDGKIRQKLHS